MKKFIKWLIKIFLSDYELTFEGVIRENERVLRNNIRLNDELSRLRIRFNNQADVVRHLEQVVQQQNQPQVGRGIVEQIREQPQVTRNNNDTSIYKNFNTRSNPIRAIKSPTKNCQWISIFNSQALINNEDSLKIIEEFTKYGSKKMVLVDIQTAVIKDIYKVFKKSHTIHFETPYENSNGSSMTIIMFKLNDKYYKKWFQPDNSWISRGIIGRSVYDQLRDTINYNGPQSDYISKIKEPVKPRPLSWKEQTRDLRFERTYQMPNKYDKKINETQKEFDLRIRKLKQQEHQQRMINGYTQTMINSPHIIHPNNF